MSTAPVPAQQVTRPRHHHFYPDERSGAAASRRSTCRRAFPDFDGPGVLKQRLSWHVSQGANQYAPMTGAAPLREAIAEKTAQLYGWQPDANSEVTVTAGATEALFAAISALVRSGDEVICFDPSYDSYAPAVQLSGGVLKRIALQPPAFKVDWQRFAEQLSPRTRLVILNTPQNPSATAWSAEDMQQLWAAIADREIYILSDEVYEHICFAKGGTPACWPIRNCVSGR
ncbi:Methionine aminotransferase [Serratia fonticola]|uniref:Methionine aminotransferase n=1 Tax=Serratia fonticola TaxID=47917 RepID=A0A4U9VGU4_SERFO|nr:Methionine aminotransferase [Serratia fonticola]